MRTQQDLLTALARREELAPDTDPVLAGARAVTTAYRRRRIATVAIAAVLAIAALVTVPSLLSDAPPDESGQRVVGSRPPLAFTIQPTTVGGFEIHPYGVTAGYQMARILAVGDDERVADMVVYEANPEVSFTPHDGELLLRWEYMPDAYAEIYGDPDPQLDDTTLQQLADGLRFTEPYSARLPYRLAYLPPGMVPYEVGQDTARAGLFGSAITMEDAASRATPVHVDIVVGVAFGSYADSGEPEPTTTIAGLPAACDDIPDGRHCSITFGALPVEITIANVSEDDLERIVAGVQLAPAWDEDPTAWYELDDALPVE
jgi:hypothetical protein